MPTSRGPSPSLDLVVEVYKRDVDRTLLARNLRLTPTERVEQLQSIVNALIEARDAVRVTRAKAAREPHD